MANVCHQAERGFKLNTSKNPGIGAVDLSDRLTQMRAIISMTRTAREDALELDLKFEAYLLNMSLIALSEQLLKETELLPIYWTGEVLPIYWTG